MNSKELSHSHRETSPLEEPIDEDLVLGTTGEREQQKEVTSSELVQGLQLPKPVVLISQRSLSDVNAVEEMEVGDNTLVVPPELADDAMVNLQLIDQMDRAMNSRNEDLLIDEEEQEMSDIEDEEMPAIESEEVQEVEEEENRDSPECRILSPSDSKSLVSKSTIDGSRKAHQR